MLPHTARIIVDDVPPCESYVRSNGKCTEGRGLTEGEDAACFGACAVGLTGTGCVVFDDVLARHVYPSEGGGRRTYPIKGPASWAGWFAARSDLAAP